MKPLLHFDDSGIDRAHIRYTWNDWASDEFFQEVDQLFVDRVTPLKTRAVYAISLGLMEWIVLRFQPFTTDEFTHQFEEAAWASMINFRYLKADLVDVDAWEGPVWGVIRETFQMVYQAQEATVSALEPAFDCACLYKLATHTIPEPRPLEDWLNAVIARMEPLYPRNEDDPVGPPVPREFLNLDYNANLNEADDLLNGFLETLHAGANPCLRTSDELLRVGFEGTPFRWDPEDDQDRYL